MWIRVKVEQSGRVLMMVKEHQPQRVRLIRVKEEQWQRVGLTRVKKEYTRWR